MSASSLLLSGGVVHTVEVTCSSTFHPPSCTAPFGTRPATWLGRASNSGPRSFVDTMPHLPSSRFFHVRLTPSHPVESDTDRSEVFDYRDHLPTPNGVTAPNPVTTTLRISSCVSTASHQRKHSTETIPKTTGNTDVMTTGLKVDGVRFLEFPLLAEMEKTARRHGRHALL